MVDFTDTVVLYDELACEDVLPVVWQPASGPFDGLSGALHDESNLHVLRASAAMDEQTVPPRDKHEDAALAADIARLEFKLSLVLDLLAQLVSRDLPRPAPTPVKFNAIGATFKAADFLPAVGSEGHLQLFLRGTLPQPLTLAGRVVGVDPPTRQVKIRFIPICEPVADLLEKLAFRKHRRNVADSRRIR
jgi:hypothetical protein